MYTETIKEVKEMLLLGNEEQVRTALEGKSGFSKEVEDELIRRVAAAEKEQEEYEPLSAVHKVGLVLCGVAGIILSIAAFL